MRISDNIKKCAVFIGTKVSDPIERIKWRGTGFLVSFPSKVADSRFPNRGFIYLVTAKHVTARIAGNDFFIRANTKDGKSIIFRGAKDHKWWFHPNPSGQTDVAVFPMIQTDVIKNLDYESIPIANLVTDETISNEGIGAGDDIFVVGLFSKHTGDEKNVPIIRMGNIALISDEPVHHHLFGNIEAYLIEMHSIGGVSGSPVFVEKPVPIALGNTLVPTTIWKWFLLGLVSGHSDVARGESIDIEDEETGATSSINAGIATIIPAKKILETLNCEELASYRAKAEAAFIAKNSPTLD